MYQLKRKYVRYVVTAVITTPSGEAKRVSFTGVPVKSTVEATAIAPAYEATIPAITQAEIENLIKTGHPYGDRFEKVDKGDIIAATVHNTKTEK